jgi:hypothetical protein
LKLKEREKKGTLIHVSAISSVKIKIPIWDVIWESMSPVNARLPKALRKSGDQITQQGGTVSGSALFISFPVSSGSRRLP